MFENVGQVSSFTEPFSSVWSSPEVSDANTLSIVGGQLAMASAGAGAALWIASFAGWDCAWWFTVPVLPTTSNPLSLYFRGSKRGGSGVQREYYVFRYTLSTTTLELRRDPGVTSSVNVGNFSTALTLVAGDAIGIIALGTSFTAWRSTDGGVTWTQVGGVVTDSAPFQIRDSQYVGFEFTDTTVRVGQLNGGVNRKPPPNPLLKMIAGKRPYSRQLVMQYLLKNMVVGVRAPVLTLVQLDAAMTLAPALLSPAKFFRFPASSQMYGTNIQNAVVDDFSGTLASWTNSAWGRSAMSISGGGLVGQATRSGIAWSTNVGPDTEVGFDIVTLPTSGNSIYVNLRASSTTSTWNGYQVKIKPSTSEWSFYRVDSGVATLIAGPFTFAVAVRNTVIVRMRNTILDAVIQDTLGMHQVGVTTEGTYNVAAKVGVEFEDAVTKIDNFIAGGFLANGSPMSPAMVKNLSYPRTLAASLVLSAAMTKIATYYRTFALTITLAVLLTKVAKFFRTNAATTTLTAAMTKVATYPRSFAGTVTLTVTMTEFKVVPKTFTGSLVLSPVMTKYAIYPRTFSASVTLIAALSKFATYMRTQSLSVTLSAAMTKFAIHYLALAYPPTFGQRNIGAVTDNGNTGHKQVDQRTVPQDGVIIGWFVRFAGHTFSGTQSVRPVVYSNSAGSPLNFIGAGKEYTVNQNDAEQWIFIYATTPISVSAGSIHQGLWFGGPVNQQIDVRCAGVGGAKYQDGDTYSSTNDPSSTFSVTGTTAGHSDYSMYAVMGGVFPVMVVMRSYARTIATSLTLTPVLTKIALFSRSFAASLVLTAALAQQRFYYRAIASSATLSPTMTKFATYNRSISGSLVLAPTMVALKTYPRSLDTTMTLSAALVEVALYQRALALTMSLNADMSRYVSGARIFNATVAMNPSVVVQAQIVRVFNLAVTLTPTLVRRLLLFRTITGALDLPAAMTFVKLAPRTFARTFVLSPTMVEHLFAPRTLDASTTLTPTMARIRIAPRSFAVTVTNSLVLTKQKLAYKVLSSTITLSPTMTRLLLLQRALGVTVAITINMLSGTAAQVEFDLALAFSAGLSRRQFYQRAMAASLSLNPVLSRLALHQLIAVVGITLTPVQATLLSMKRSFSGSIVIAPIMVRRLSLHRAFSAPLTLSAALARRSSGQVAFEASLALTAALTSRAVYRRKLDLAFALDATLTRRYRAVKQFALSIPFIRSFFHAAKVSYYGPLIHLVVATKPEPAQLVSATTESTRIVRSRPFIPEVVRIDYDDGDLIETVEQEAEMVRVR